MALMLNSRGEVLGAHPVIKQGAAKRPGKCFNNFARGQPKVQLPYWFPEHEPVFCPALRRCRP